MSDSLLAILAGAGVHLLAVVTPGPNFLVVSRTALAYSRATAMWVTVGITTGAIIIITSGFLGASAIFTRSERLYDSVRLVGAAYLAYLGIRALWGWWRSRSTDPTGPMALAGPAPGPGAAVRLGLLTLASNAKSFIYFMVFFTSIVPPDLPTAARVTLVVVMPSISFSWYSFVSWAFSGHLVRGWYARLQRPVELVFGFLLLFVGIEVALSV
jgi:threonine/homoserine/homoserine lactone efflux protein